MRDQIEFEQLDCGAEPARADGCGTSDPVAHVMDRVVPLGRVDEDGAHAFRYQRIGQRMNLRQERSGIGCHQRRVGLAIGQRPEGRRRPRAGLCQERSRVVESGIRGRTGTVRQYR